MTAAPLGSTPVPCTLEWDAENRLKAVYPTEPATGSKKVEYTYDYMNRRVARKVFDWDPELGENGDWESTPSEHTRYVYHGWNVILELNALSSNAILKKYTWGLDLAGQNGQVNSLDAAGGIGGLLACLDTAGTPSTADDRTFVYSYDANGNVTQLVETTTGGNYGTLAAAYEYDAYGNTVVASFGYADDNLIRFSTRPIDPLTLLGHWAMRVLDFERGRWGSRDPIGARGGLGLYGFVANAPTAKLDPLGLFELEEEASLTIPCCCKDARFRFRISLNQHTRSRTRLATVIYGDDTDNCCDDIKYMQIISNLGGRWKLDDGSGWFDGVWSTTPWYPIVDHSRTRDVGSSYDLEDTPGVRWDPLGYYATGRQDFESCAICVKRSNAPFSELVGCVLTCFQWGHAWTPNQHTWYVRPASGPSGVMTPFLAEASRISGLWPIRPSCDDLNGLLNGNDRYDFDRAQSGYGR